MSRDTTVSKFHPSSDKVRKSWGSNTTVLIPFEPIAASHPFQYNGAMLHHLLELFVTLRRQLGVQSADL